MSGSAMQSLHTEMRSLCVFIVLASIGAVLAQSTDSSEDELVSLQFVYRHGDRTPKSLYKNDPYRHYGWPEGLAALTAKGKERMYEFAKVIRKRYSHYIGK